MSNPNVIVLGGGPAGTATAISCAQRGLKVVIIEGERFPRYCPGESLHPGIEPLLKELGVVEQIQKAEFLRHMGNWVQWEGERRFVPFGSDETGPWLGFQAWRADFDAILLQRAISLGVEVHQPCRALQPIIRNKRVVGVITSIGEMRSPFVIDATGRRQWLAQKLKLGINKYSPHLITRYGYVEGECPIRDDAPSIVADSRGWTWTAKVRPQVYQWTRLSFVNEALDKSWLPEEFQGLKLLGNTRGANMTWRMAIHPGGPGYLLVGDAAAVLDPASSHGVLKAVMSGMLAGHLIVEILKEGKSEHRAIQGYCEWVYNWFKHDVEELRKLYALLPNFKSIKY
jgi:flavin-dependent dehydrogenase